MKSQFFIIAYLSDSCTINQEKTKNSCKNTQNPPEFPNCICTLQKIRLSIAAGAVILRFIFLKNRRKSAWLYFKKWIRFIFYRQWKQKNIATVKQKSGKICNHFCFILQKWYFFNKKNLKKWNFSGITIRFFEVFLKKTLCFRFVYGKMSP